MNYVNSQKVQTAAGGGGVQYRPVTAKTSRADTIMNKVYKSHSRMLSQSSMKSTDANSRTIEHPESHNDQQLSSPRGVIINTAITPRENRSSY